MAELLVETLLHYRAEKKYSLHDFVVMPDHVHFILTPDQITLERAMQFVKGGFSHRAGLLNPKQEIWQRGFVDHRVRDSSDYARHREYILLNPVRAKLCEKPEEYPYSSANGRYQLDLVPQRLKPLV
jgi:putative transposase